MRRVFIASPFRGRLGYTETDHRILLDKLIRAAIHAGVSPYAPHRFFPFFLDDAIEAEKNFGIEAGKRWLAVSDEIWVWAPNGFPPSAGMESEIAVAKSLGKPVLVNPPEFSHCRLPTLTPPLLGFSEALS